MFGKFMVSLPPPEEEEEGKLNSAPEENLHVWRRRWHFFSLLVCGSVFVQALASYPRRWGEVYRVGEEAWLSQGPHCDAYVSSHPGKNTSEILSPFPFLFTHI